MSTLLNEADLPAQARETIARARASLLSGRAPRVHSAAALDGGCLWFADGIDLSLTVRDELRLASPALAFFGAIGAGVYASYAFSEGDALRWPAAAFAVVLAAIGVAAAMSNIGRKDRAIARMELGTLLAPDFFAYLSHGRAVVIPRGDVLRTALVTEGSGESKEEVRVVFFRAPDGQERSQRITGFFRDETGVEQLRAWIAGR